MGVERCSAFVCWFDDTHTASANYVTGWRRRRRVRRRGRETGRKPWMEKKKSKHL